MATNYYVSYDEDFEFILGKIAGYARRIKYNGSKGLTEADLALVRAYATALKNILERAESK